MSNPSDAASMRQLRLERRTRLREGTAPAAAQQPEQATNENQNESHEAKEQTTARRSSRGSASSKSSLTAAAAPVPVSATSSSPRGQERRETTSTSAAVAINSGTASVKPAKKSKSSSNNSAASSKSSSSSSTSVASSRRNYNLRSTVARGKRAGEQEPLESSGAAVATVITPRTPAISARHIHFDGSSKLVAAGSTLPPGVIDIFCRDNHCQLCKCPTDRCVLTDTSVGFSHIVAYGEENGEILKEKEIRQMDEIKLLLPERTRVQGSPAETNDDDLEEDENVDDEFSDEEDDSRSSTVRFRRLNFQESIRSCASTTSRANRLSSPTSPSSPQPSSSPNFLYRQPYLSPRMRGILVHWLVEVGQEYKVSETAFHLAVSILDQLLLKGPTAEQLSDYDDEEDADEGPWFLVTRSDFQAVGCACAWIAAKLEDKNAPSVEDFVWISDYSFHSNKLRFLEERVCRELDFHLNRVTPFHFVNLFLRASNACPSGGCCEFDHPVLREVTMYLLALSRLSYELSLCKPSLLAAAAVYLARATVGVRDLDHPIHAVHPEGYWTRTLEFYTGYKREELRSAVLVIHRYQLAAEKAENIKGIFTKFSKAAHHFASLKTALRVDDLGFETRLTHDNTDFEIIQMEPF